MVMDKCIKVNTLFMFYVYCLCDVLCFLWCIHIYKPFDVSSVFFVFSSKTPSIVTLFDALYVFHIEFLLISLIICYSINSLLNQKS